jgi:hypothetical protein
VPQTDAALRTAARARQFEFMERAASRRAELLSAFERSIHDGYRLPWRLAETPGVAPRALIDRDLAAMRAIVEPFARPEVFDAALARVPKRYRRADSDRAFPRFVATDFHRVFDERAGVFRRRVPEAQSFPGNMLLKPAMAAAFHATFDLAPEARRFLDRRFKTADAYRAYLRALVLGPFAPEETILLEVRPELQATVVDMELWCRLLRCPLVDLFDLEVDERTGELLYRRALVFDEGRPPRKASFDRPRRAKNILSRCLPSEIDRAIDERVDGFDAARAEAIFRTSTAKGAASFVVHPQDFFVVSKDTLAERDEMDPPLLRFEPETLARLDAAGVPFESGVLKPAYFAGGQGVAGVDGRSTRDDVVRACERLERERRAATDDLDRLRKTWFWQRRFEVEPYARQDVFGFRPGSDDDRGPVYHEIRFMWAVERDADGRPNAWVPLVGMTRWSRVGDPANASRQKSAFTGTQAYLATDDAAPEIGDPA